MAPKLRYSSRSHMKTYETEKASFDNILNVCTSGSKNNNDGSTKSDLKDFEFKSSHICKKLKINDSPEKVYSTELSEYEKQVQNNIAERMKFLEQLEIFDVKKKFEDTVALKKSQIIRSKPKTKKKQISKIKKFTERRKSSRLHNSLEICLSKSDTEINTDVDEVVVSDPSPGPAALHTYYSEEDEMESSEFLSNLKNLSKVKGTYCWNGSDKQTQNLLESLKNRESDMMKVIPTTVYSMAIHPTSEKSTAFVGGHNGELGIFYVDNSNYSRPGNSYDYRIHSRAINCMTIDISNGNNLYTTSFDGSVKKLDLVTLQSEQIYLCGEDYYIFWHAQLDDSCLLVTGSSGLIDQVDTRCSPSKTQHYKLDSNHRIRVVTVNPSNNLYFSTGSSDGMVCLWDLRNINKELCSIHAGKSVNGLEYSAQTGKYLLTTTCLDIRVFESTSVSELKYKNKIIHNNNTGRWIRPFRASWLPGSESLFVIGSMDNPRRIEVWNHDGDLIHSIFGDSLQSVSCVNAFHPYRKILLGANSSGKVHVFT